MSESSRWTEEEMETAKKGKTKQAFCLLLKVTVVGVLITERNNAHNSLKSVDL